MDDVNQRLTEMRTAALKAQATPLEPTLNPVMADTLFELGFKKAWGENWHLFDVVPHTWLREIERMDFIVKDLQYEVNVHRKAFIPPDCKLRGFGTYIDVPMNANETPKELYTAIETYENKKKEIHDTFNSVSNQVEGFLRNSKSLNAACAAYPNLRLYIPQHYLSRIDEVVERKSRKEKDEEARETVEALDDSLLASVGVIHAISGKGE